MTDTICVFQALNLAFGLSSLGLGILAGGLSVYFFVQTKGTESKITNSLAEIKAQSDILKSISDKHITALIERVGTPNPQVQFVLERLMSEYGESVDSTVHDGQKGKTEKSDITNSIADTHSLEIALFFMIDAAFLSNSFKILALKSKDGQKEHFIDSIKIAAGHSQLAKKFIESHLDSDEADEAFKSRFEHALKVVSELVTEVPTGNA